MIRTVTKDINIELRVTCRKYLLLRIQQQIRQPSDPQQKTEYIVDEKDTRRFKWRVYYRQKGHFCIEKKIPCILSDQLDSKTTFGNCLKEPAFHNHSQKQTTTTGHFGSFRWGHKVNEYIREMCDKLLPTSLRKTIIRQKV